MFGSCVASLMIYAFPACKGFFGAAVFPFNLHIYLLEVKRVSVVIFLFFYFESTIYNAGLEHSPQAALQIQVTTLRPLIPALPPIKICAS
jgi:hypothetical protein